MKITITLDVPEVSCDSEQADHIIQSLQLDMEALIQDYPQGAHYTIEDALD